MSADTRRFVVAMLVLTGILGLGGALCYYDIPDQNLTFLTVIITYLVAKGGTIIDYDFTSSAGAEVKNATISKQADTINLAAKNASKQ